ncbi:MAG: Rpn family recombination-promoting nuclease/putative transposase, partial [Planctomycetaceae bacterium]|nr:Rpn family recombination-promoting nuclease/putative transposase [Planctomycetaceae bacterium]
DEIPAILREPVFEKAFNTAEYIKFPPAIQEAYQKDLTAYRDNNNVLETARQEGLEEGEAKGKIETARNLKRLGVDQETISKATGLSVSEIERLI